jgi:hypothetical protein
MENLKAKIEKTTLLVRREQMLAIVSDDFASEAEKFAERLTDTKVEMAQIRGLENLANTTDRISDIVGWLKLRVGRDGKHERWAKDGVGRDLIIRLQALKDSVQKTAAQVGESYARDFEKKREIHLLLCREFIRHIATHFEYAKAKEESNA